MDLEEILARLDSATSSTGTLEIEILAYKNFYVAPSPDAELDDAAMEKLERRFNLARQLEGLLESIRLETNPEKVVRKATILISASSLLGREFETSANYQVGHYLIQLDKCAEAQRFIERADSLFKESDEYGKQFPLHIALAKLTCLEQTRDYQQIENYSRELINNYKSEDFRPLHVMLYASLASAYQDQGKFNLALEASRSGLQAAADSTDEFSTKHTVKLQSIIGQAARSSGRYSEALTAFAACRNLAQKTAARRAAATALSEVGITWFQIGEEERGRTILEQAAKEAEQAGYAEDAERWRATLPATIQPTDQDSTIQILVWAAALLREDPPRTEEARRLAILCIERASKEGDWRTQLESRNCLAAAYDKEERYSQAIAAAKQAVRGALNFNDVSKELVFRTNLGNCYYHAGRIKDAETELRLAIETGKTARAGASTTEIRQAISGSMRHAYEALALILAQEWPQRDGKVLALRVDKLLEVLQETRAANLAGWVAADNVISKRGLASLNDPLLMLRAANVRIEMEMLSNAGDITHLLEDLEQTRERFTAATDSLGIPVTIDPPIYSAKELQQSLRAGEYLVDLYGLTEHILITVLPAEGQPQRLLLRWSKRDRSDFLDHWRMRVARDTAPDRKGQRLRQPLDVIRQEPIDLPPNEVPLSQLIKRFQTHFLDALMKMLSDGTPSRLIIVPHRELALLPFSAIADYLPGVSISVLPGANVSKLISERLRSTVGPRLAIKDPTDSLDYAAIEIADLPGFEILSPDIDAIVRGIGRAHILHCAGHGMFNDQNPYLSGVIAQRFAGSQPRVFGARTPVLEEELLTVAEVLARAHLSNCYLVTLSACSTGLPREHPANEFIGLPTAFLIAGAKNVIGSLWPVDDAATCLLMREFYAHFVQDNKIVSTPSASLAFARDRLGKLCRSDIVEILRRDSHIIPDLEYPYAGAEYTLAFQHYGVD